jgi:hypothetical protein
VDHCDVRLGCVHQAPTGLDGVICRLEAIDAILASTPPDQLGGADRQVKLRKRIGLILRLLRRAQTAHGRLAVDNPRRARVYLRHFIVLIQHGEARKKDRIPAELGDRLVKLGTDALASLEALLPPRRH